MDGLSIPFNYQTAILLMRSYNPEHSTEKTKGNRLLSLVPSVECSVWAKPRSLAATQGISVDFFSSGY